MPQALNPTVNAAVVDSSTSFLDLMSTVSDNLMSVMQPGDAPVSIVVSPNKAYMILEMSSVNQLLKTSVSTPIGDYRMHVARATACCAVRQVR